MATDPARNTEVAAGLVLGTLLLVTVAVSEIGADWQLHVRPPFEPETQIIGVSILAGAAIMWPGLRRTEERVRAVGGAVLAIALYALFTIQLLQAPVGYVTALNGRAIAGVFASRRSLRSSRDASPLRQPHHPVDDEHCHLFHDRRSVDPLAPDVRNRCVLGRPRGSECLVGCAGGSSVGCVGRYWRIPDLVRPVGVGVLGVVASGAGCCSSAVFRLLRLHFASPTPVHVLLANARVMTSIVVIALLYGPRTWIRGTIESEYPPSRQRSGRGARHACCGAATRGQCADVDAADRRNHRPLARVRRAPYVRLRRRRRCASL